MKEIENKKTSKISNAILEEENLSARISDDQLQGEFNYSQADKILKKMLEKGLINEVEFNKIDELNRKTFSPILNKIMPVNR
ncbi:MULTISPECIES: SHOCT domain-containing protein [Lactococcus]|uniref:SHOCT domain-containing protein n=1 Tax=Lactococcus TaxID=1357 RepID=UPI001F06FC47|nr:MULTISPECIES: SHOCT domain-containing protein [Lactococcus]MCH1714039.1 hypothetical protein [Lactococcus petauri]MDT2852655.1 hypothetical protein [Lactococcus lactis]